MPLFDSFREILVELQKFKDLSSAQRQQVDRWLTQGNEGDLTKQFSALVEIAAVAGISASGLFSRLSIALAPTCDVEVYDGYFRKVPLPTALTIQSLKTAMSETQRMLFKINHNLRESTGYPLINFIQANNFSGIVSNMLTDALDKSSPYKHNHDQRYPDLKNRNNGIGLEMKAANKPGKGGESHNGHGGWHLIACFDLDESSGNIRFIHLEIAELIGHTDDKEGDWHYCGSKVNEDTGSQRTETYYTTRRGTSKLRDGSVYLDYSRVTTWSRWQHDSSYPAPTYSPTFYQGIEGNLQVPSLSNPKKTKMWRSVKKELFSLDPNWPLYTKEKLESMKMPENIIRIIQA